MKIEKNIPIPKRSSRGKFSILKEMKVGDSILIDDGVAASNAASYYWGKGNYSSQREEKGTRIWRIK